MNLTSKFKTYNDLENFVENLKKEMEITQDVFYEEYKIFDSNLKNEVKNLFNKRNKFLLTLDEKTAEEILINKYGIKKEDIKDPKTRYKSRTSAEIRKYENNKHNEFLNNN